MSTGKAAGLDGVYGEMLKVGGDSVVEWLERMFKVCWEKGEIPQDWQDACVVPIYKGKGDRMECGNHRGISLLSVVGKVYGRVLMMKLGRRTEEIIGEEQGGFREGRGCMDQVFTLRMIEEKCREKKKDLFVCFLDLEKAYDRVDRGKLWEVLGECGVVGKLGRGLRAFYKNSRACVRIKRRETEFFEVECGLRQGCVLSPSLFNMFIDRVVKSMRREGMGVKMRDRQGNWDVNTLLYADDTVLVSETDEGLKWLVGEFERKCTEYGLKINAGKSKVVCMINTERVNGDNKEEWGRVRVGGEQLERVTSFKYLGVKFGGEGGEYLEVGHRIKEGEKVLGGLKDIWKRGRLTREVKVKMFESYCLPVVLYGSEVWRINARMRRKIEVFEMKALRAVCGIGRMDRVRNVRIREMCEWKRGVVERAEQGILRWFGHVCRMSEERNALRVFKSEVEGTRGRGRPKGG